jgi:zinc and cadmium transporter
MSPLTLLLAYGAALVLFSLAGGALPQRVHMTHTRAQLAMSLVSGLMLGIAFFHLLPHAVHTLGITQGINSVMVWAMFGLVVMLLLLRLLHFHQPDHYEDPGHDCDGEHAHEHMAHPEPVRVSWKGVLTGLTFHTFIDGVALGAALLVASHGHGEELLGFGVFLAILLHKPLDAMSITALMQAAGASASARTRANILFAIVCPLGAIAFYYSAVALGGPAGVDATAGVGAAAGELVAAALAFSAGAFICIALSDLLPEVQFHSHDRVKLTLVFLLGIGLSYLMTGAAPEHSHALAALQLGSVSGGG